MDLGDCREEGDFDLTDSCGGQIGEELAVCQVTGPTADSDAKTELHGTTRGVEEIVGLRPLAGDEMDLLHAPDGQSREDRVQLTGFGQRHGGRLRWRHGLLGQPNARIGFAGIV